VTVPAPVGPGPYFQDEKVTLYHGDCIEVLATLPDCSVDAVVTDPPYGLGFMGKAWDTPGPAVRPRADGNHDANPYKRSRAEFGGASYGGDHAREMRDFGAWCEQWAAECLRVLKPGGHMLAFGGTRTWHRLACAVEDAGFEIRDSIAWLYGSGFPKSLDVSKAIDKAAGAERGTVVGHGYAGPRSTLTTGNPGIDAWREARSTSHAYDITAPATEAAQRWQGWGTAMKPAHEPVVCARKPFSVVPLGEVHRALGVLLWLSLSPAKRAETLSKSSRLGQPGAACASALVSAATDTSPGESDATDTFNSPALESTCWNIVSSWNAISGALSGQTITSTTSTKSSMTTGLRTLSSLLGPLTSQTTTPANETPASGPASNAPSAAAGSIADWESWTRTLRRSVPESATEGIALAAASLLAPLAESSSDDRAAGSTAAPTATTGAASRGSAAHEPIVVARKPLIGTVAQNVTEHGTGALNIDACRIGADVRTTHGMSSLGVMHDDAWVPGSVTTTASGRWPANVALDESQAEALDRMSGITTSGSGSGGIWSPSTGKPAGPQHGDTGGASRFFYTAKAPGSERPDGPNAHPTVKPLGLMRWLVRLVTPPGGVVLDPFAGSGTTVEAALGDHFRCIAIERETDYLPLIMSRINWTQMGLFGHGDDEGDET
jgi:DNA modification methylase